MDIIKILSEFKAAFFTTLMFVALYYVIRYLLDKQRARRSEDSSLLRSIILFVLFIIAAITIILSLPFEESTRGQISSLIGIILAAVLSLSSATFIGNAFAGIMLRTINNFKPGDFIEVKGHFGRISESGLFHTEIQTENRDLTTLPNLLIATNPIKVTRSSGTFIKATCSLGYDVSRIKIEKALIEAATNAGLEDPFVFITEMGDFSVVYKVHGLLKDVKKLLSAKSKLNAMVLDALHDANIEIVSPSFMNQRAIGDTVFIPKKTKKMADTQKEMEGKPEVMVFDKADEAASIEDKKKKMAEIDQKIKELSELKKASNLDDEMKSLEAKINKWTVLRNKMLERIQNQINDTSD